MGVSGQVFSGAEEQLRQLIEEQVFEEQMQARKQEAEARRKIDEARAAEQKRQFDVVQQADMEDSTSRMLRSDRDALQRRMDAATDRMEVDTAIEGLPGHLKSLAGPMKVGLVGKLSPDDMEDPQVKADRLAGAAAQKRDEEFNEYKRRADYQEGQMRDRPPKAPTGPSGLTAGQESTALKLQDDYARDSKPYLLMRDAYQRVASTEPSAAGDLSLIFAYMKILDPNSVVRETEFANAQNAAGVLEQIQNTWNRMLKGERLNPHQRDQFRNQAKSLFGNAEQNQQKVRATYADRAQRWQIPPEMVVDKDDRPQNGPPVGTRKTVMGQLAEWDGKGWLPVKQ